MENQDTKTPRNFLSKGLTAGVKYCSLCDSVFIGEIESHSIVSGYNPKNRAYTPSGKFEVEHRLDVLGKISLTSEQLEQELDDVVAYVLLEIGNKAPLSKKEPDIEFHVRRILLDYYAKKGGD